MAIITIASSKGGAGKTTLAQLLAGYVAERGHRVAVIDADLNHSFASWAKTFQRYPFTVREELREGKIVPLADELDQRHDLVVIDTAGAATQATIYAMGIADAVLIPVQASASDVVEALKTKERVDGAARVARRAIPVFAVMSDYQPNTIISAHVEAELVSCNLPTLETKLNRLVAFKEMTFNGEVPATGKAGELVEELVGELRNVGALPFLAMKEAS